MHKVLLRLDHFERILQSLRAVSRWPQIVVGTAFVLLQAFASFDAYALRDNDECSTVVTSLALQIAQKNILLEEIRSKGDHERLGVGKDASADEIHGAYRRKAKEFHPDLVEHLNNATLVRIYSEIFKLMGESYKRLVSGDARLFGAEITTPARSKQAFDPARVDDYAEQVSKSLMAQIKKWNLEGFEEPIVDNIMTALQWNHESTMVDPRAFRMGRAKALQEIIPKIIKQSQSTQELYVAFKLAQLVDLVKMQIDERHTKTWRRLLRDRSYQISPKTASDVLKTIDLTAHSLSGDFDELLIDRHEVLRLIRNQSKAWDVSESEIAFDVLQELMNQPSSHTYWRPNLGEILIQTAALGLSTEQIHRFKDLILANPLHLELQREIVSMLKWRVKNRPDLSLQIQKIFGVPFLEKHDFFVSYWSKLVNFFDRSDFSNVLKEEARQALFQTEAAAVLQQQGVDGPFKMRFGDRVVSIQLEEVQKLSQMSFEKASRYLEDKFNIKVVEVKDYRFDSEIPKHLEFYHSLLAMSGSRAAFIPAHPATHSGESFSNQPVIAIKSEFKNSLPHEFVHFLTFDAVEKLSKIVGAKHEMLETAVRWDSLERSAKGRKSSVWNRWDDERDWGKFSSEDLKLFRELMIARAQFDFQRLRDELMSDRMHFAAIGDRKDLQAYRMEHFHSEWERFQDTTLRNAASIDRRLSKIHQYLTEEEYRQLAEVADYLLNLRAQAKSLVDDLNYVGPQELLRSSDRQNSFETSIVKASRKIR